MLRTQNSAPRMSLFLRYSGFLSISLLSSIVIGAPAAIEWTNLTSPLPISSTSESAADNPEIADKRRGSGWVHTSKDVWKASDGTIVTKTMNSYAQTEEGWLVRTYGTIEAKNELKTWSIDLSPQEEGKFIGETSKMLVLEAKGAIFLIVKDGLNQVFLFPEKEAYFEQDKDTVIFRQKDGVFVYTLGEEQFQKCSYKIFAKINEPSLKPNVTVKDLLHGIWNGEKCYFIQSTITKATKKEIQLASNRTKNRVTIDLAR